MTASTRIIELRELLAAKYPTTPSRGGSHLPTGLGRVDAALGGGLPHGGTVEIVCQGGGGGLLLAALLRSTQERRGLMALIDGADSFDFAGVPQAALSRLLWVRGRSAARAVRPFGSLADLLTRVSLDRDERRTLAALGAFNGFSGHRRDALWQVEQPVADQPDLFNQDDVGASSHSPLLPMDAGERLQADFDGQNLTTGPHAMALLRPHLPEGIWRATDLVHAENGQRVLIAGNVICRQRPGTAKGFVFVSLEDETGIANAIVTPALFEERRLTLSQEAFLLIEGRVQIAEGTIHIKATHIEGLRQARAAHAKSHDFH